MREVSVEIAIPSGIRSSATDVQCHCDTLDRCGGRIHVQCTDKAIGVIVRNRAIDDHKLSFRVEECDEKSCRHSGAAESVREIHGKANRKGGVRPKVSRPQVTGTLKPEGASKSGPASNESITIEAFDCGSDASRTPDTKTARE